MTPRILTHISLHISLSPTRPFVVHDGTFELAVFPLDPDYAECGTAHYLVNARRLGAPDSQVVSLDVTMRTPEDVVEVATVAFVRLRAWLDGADTIDERLNTIGLALPCLTEANKRAWQYLDTVGLALTFPTEANERAWQHWLDFNKARFVDGFVRGSSDDDWL